MPQPDNQSLDVRLEPIPTATLFEYRKKNLTYDEIGKIHGLTKQAVHSRLKDAGLADHSLHNYTTNRADILAWLQGRLLFSLTDAEIKRMAPDRRIWCYGVLYDKERLERGMSTDNISISSIAMHIQGELAEHRARGKVLFEEMSKRGLSATNLSNRSTIDTKSDGFVDIGDIKGIDNDDAI